MKKNDIQGILLDIEGTTSSIAFVYDVMFPYVREHLRPFLSQHWESDKLDQTVGLLADDQNLTRDWLAGLNEAQAQDTVATAVIGMMDADRKTTGLKQLQGMIWKAGFESGQLVGHLFDEVGDCIRNWAASGIDVRIYSSGSIAAQKLYFGHSTAGDLLPFIKGHYDTTIGSKQDTHSYQKIAADYDLDPSRILFISDVPEEIMAAKSAGMQTRLSLRPGNKPIPTSHGLEAITSFQQA